MATRLAVVAIFAAFVWLPSCSSASDTSTATRATPATPAVAACVRANIGGQEQCLVAGRPCSPRYERRYQRHGFECRLNTAGKYRLWTPIKPGQTKP